MSSGSPTPMSSSQQSLTRRSSQRQALRPTSFRTGLTRSDSSSSTAAPSSYASKPALRVSAHVAHDSSDDEIPVPMKLSALTKALLNDDNSDGSKKVSSPPMTRRRSILNSQKETLPNYSRASTEERRHLRSSSSSYDNRQASPQNAPSTRREEPSPPRKRVVRLSNTPKSLSQMGHRRSNSVSRTGMSGTSATSTTVSAVSTNSTSNRSRRSSRPSSRDGYAEPKSASSANTSFNSSYPSVAHDVNTPAGSHVVRVGHSSAEKSGDHKSHENQSSAEEAPHTVARPNQAGEHASVSRYGRNRLEDNIGLQSSMRVKRIGLTPGGFLSGPVRRGMMRQTVEDVDHDMIDSESPAVSVPQSLENRESHESYEGRAEDRRGRDHEDVGSSRWSRQHGDYGAGSPGSRYREVRHPGSQADLLQSVSRASPDALMTDRDHDWDYQYNYQSQADNEAPTPAGGQENNLASYIRSSRKPSPKAEKMHPMSVEAPPAPALREQSPDRKPLTMVNNNIPHRPAPPPPAKVSITDAATAAGPVKQRRNVIKVNGKVFTRLDCLGRGGSAKVYRVTADNGKMWALKRVALEHADEMTIKGYKGEIDLLRKLDKVDRVVSLLDYEMNHEKQLLTIVMEMGELDMNTLLKSRQGFESAKLDTVFVRFYWKEMLECVNSVHGFDIVHSDLKPANFVLVQGRLKLIDFGIANAIQTDETVNVHREAQIGTPNYMSPESLMDYNALHGARVPGRPKLMKLGKPSDVWSLGCILYQLVYGYPPFGHIANQMARCQAIINWDHVIEFPSHGIGDVPVPPSLIRTMRRCLDRDAHKRPTCIELLDHTDPFLYPVETSDKIVAVSQEMLGKVIHSIVSRCKNEMPTDGDLPKLTGLYFESVKKAMLKAENQTRIQNASSS